MSLLDYKSFVLSESFIFESADDHALFQAFQKVYNNIPSDKLQILKSVGAKELSNIDMYNPSNTVTVSNTVIKTRSGPTRVGEYAVKPNFLQCCADSNFIQSVIDNPDKSESRKAFCILFYLFENPLNRDGGPGIIWGSKNPFKKEELQLQDIQSKIKELSKEKSELLLQLYGKVVNLNTPVAVAVLDSVSKTPGNNPKSDFSMVLTLGNSEKTVYISMKDKAKDEGKGFQQWGGITKDKAILDNVFIKKFMGILSNKLGRTELKNGEIFACPVPASEVDICVKTIFGTEAGVNNVNFSKENVQVVVEGLISFENVPGEEGIYRISESSDSHVLYHPAITGNSLVFSNGTSSLYWPSILVSYRSDKGGGVGWTNARFGLWAQGNGATQRGIQRAEEIGINTKTVMEFVG